MCVCLYNLLTAIAPHLNQVGTPESDVDIGGDDESTVFSQDDTQFLPLTPTQPGNRLFNNVDEALNANDSLYYQPFAFDASQ